MLNSKMNAGEFKTDGLKAFEDEIISVLLDSTTSR